MCIASQPLTRQEQEIRVSREGFEKAIRFVGLGRMPVQVCSVMLF